MKTVCEKDSCTGCKACIDICPKNAIQIVDSLSVYNAEIQEDKCIQCNACHRVCQVNNIPEKKRPISWFQGWINNPELRKKSSSGGAARALSECFIKNGGEVYSCTFINGEFIYECTYLQEDLKKFTGSKYVKSNPVGVYKEIKRKIKDGKQILFIGLPCHVGALKNYVGDKENLYTVDLICHGTPSPEILDKYLQQHQYSLKNLKNLEFRINNDFHLNCNEKMINNSNIRDSYTIAFLDGLSYTENCYNCQYACLERISDITIGDSWGSELAKEEQKKGISLVLCQTQKGERILNESDFTTKSVDLENAINHNHQLKLPTKKNAKTEKFYKGLRKEKSFDKLVNKYMLKAVIKQHIKVVLKKII